MYNLQVLTAIVLFGLSLVHGFFQIMQNDFLLQNEQSVFSSNVPQEFINTIEQRLDHFNDSDKRTWSQMYFKNSNYWKPGGPILLFLVGDGCCPLYADLNSKDFFINEIAEGTDAAYFILDPRYYGLHKPFDFDQLSVENLKFLTSRQTLADIAYLLVTLKESPEFKNSKVILVGGFYGGSLAVWAKLWYPDLIDAVVSSSAPLLAKKDFNEYYETVTDVFRTYGSQECVDKIAEKFSYLYELFQTPEGIEKLKKEYNICTRNDMTLPENQQLFFVYQIMPFENIVNSGDPANVSLACENIGLIEEENQFSIIKNDNSCNIYNFIDWVKIFLVYQMNRIPWLYQSCTEFGYFQTTSSSNQMFGNALPIDFYYKMCSTAFGKEFNAERIDQGIIRTNQMFGGLTPNVTNVVFVNEDMNPWRALEVMQDLSPDAQVVNINGTHLCTDYYKHPTDSDNVKEARKKIKEFVKKIIGQA